MLHHSAKQHPCGSVLEEAENEIGKISIFPFKYSDLKSATQMTLRKDLNMCV